MAESIPFGDSTLGCAYGGSAGALAKTGSPVVAPQVHGEAWMGFGHAKACIKR